MTPAQQALREAAAAETARIYAATLRENTAKQQAELDTPEAVARRRRVAESITERHLRSVS